MSHAHAHDTVPAFPLGQPIDGRKRYSMTPEQASLYRWLIANRPSERPFAMDFRDIARQTPTGLYALHVRVQALVERGWIMPVTIKPGHSTYSFVHPIKYFKEPTRG